MLATRRSRYIVITSMVLFGILFTLAAVTGDKDNSDDSNISVHPPTQSASSNTLTMSKRRKMEITSTREDGTEYCVSLAANGKHPQQVKLKNCGPTVVNLVYDDVSTLLEAHKKLVILLDYDYTEFSVDIESSEGVQIGNFQPA